MRGTSGRGSGLTAGLPHSHNWDTRWQPQEARLSSSLLLGPDGQAGAYCSKDTVGPSQPCSVQWRLCAFGDQIVSTMYQGRGHERVGIQALVSA